MGLQQLIAIVLVVIIVGITIAVGVSVFRQQGIELEKKILDELLFQVGGIIYQHYLLPLSHGGFGKSVQYMKKNEDKVIALLPALSETTQEILYTKGQFANKGFNIKMWSKPWQKFAIGVRSKTYDFERWILVHCTSGRMEIKSKAPNPSDFTT